MKWFPRNPNLNQTNCECMSCHLEFKSVAAFDKHRADLRCLTIPEMERLGMAVNRNGLWVTKEFSADVGERMQAKTP